MHDPDGRPTVLGRIRTPEFECSPGPLPDKMRVLLWLADGAESREARAREWTGAKTRPARPLPPGKQRRPG